MTSNIGSPHLIENASETGEIAEDVRKKVMAELRAHFRPEFLNRVDDIVLFKPLTLAEIKTHRRTCSSICCALGWPTATSNWS